ncbi:MAG: NADH-quinone oxidoreductase subunit M [Calditrichia bacterium]
MLNVIIFLPLFTGLIILLLPKSNPAAIRWTALAAALINLTLAAVLWGGYTVYGSHLQWRTAVDWIPSIGARYEVAVDGISLPLITLTALLMTLVMIYVLPKYDKPKGHAFLFLLMQTGLTGVFASRDLLLFYLFFEVGLVPMYFVIGIWGHERRKYAAIKFFLYTRAGSLAMLLSFLGLYLSMDPHTFSLDAIIQAQPLAAHSSAAGLVLLGMLIGFGVKLPIFPLHNWLPDAHVEAPTEGSVILAGVQLKMGAYGMLAVMLPTLSGAAQRYGWMLAVLGVIGVIYGALAALAQKDFKRLVAYTSINHMGYVMLGAAVWALSSSAPVKQLAINGAALQMVSHGLLTGGMFFMVGMLQNRVDTREMNQFGGLMGKVPLYSAVLGILAFGSLGLPGLSGFIAEFQVIGATLSISLWAAVLTILGLIIATGLYIKIIITVLMGEAPENMKVFSDLKMREILAVLPLIIFSFLIGIFPGLIVSLIQRTSEFLSTVGF